MIFSGENKMYLKFGNGKTGVTTVIYENKETILLIEPGKGTGEIGGCPIGREKNTELDLNELNTDENIIMEFTNIPSIQVVIDALETIKKGLT